MTSTAIEDLLASLVARKSRAGLVYEARGRHNTIRSARVERRRLMRRTKLALPQGSDGVILKFRVESAPVGEGGEESAVE